MWNKKFAFSLFKLVKFPNAHISGHRLYSGQNNRKWKDWGKYNFEACHGGGILKEKHITLLFYIFSTTSTSNFTIPYRVQIMFITYMISFFLKCFFLWSKGSYKYFQFFSKSMFSMSILSQWEKLKLEYFSKSSHCITKFRDRWIHEVNGINCGTLITLHRYHSTRSDEAICTEGKILWPRRLCGIGEDG